tara:strand:- start:1940 stop:2212 length:273 start_codon:yes stop_codon:yes gene_type:complete
MLKTLSITNEDYINFLETKDGKYLNKLSNILSDGYVNMQTHPTKKPQEVVPHIFLLMALRDSSKLLQKHISKKYGNKNQMLYIEKVKNEN